MLKQFLLDHIEAYQKNIFKATFQKFVIVLIVGFGEGKHFIAYCLLALQQTL